MTLEDSFLDELGAMPTSSKESAQILQDFRDDWEKQSNNYQGWLSVGASPEDAAARTIQPVLAKWASFAPVMRSMVNTSRNNPFSIFQTGGGELTRANKFTGDAEVIKQGRPAVTRPDAFETVVEKIPAVRGVASQPAQQRSFMGIDWLRRDQPAVEGVTAKPEQFVTRRVPIAGAVPGPEPFEDTVQPAGRGFIGTPQGEDKTGLAYGADNSFVDEPFATAASPAQNQRVKVRSRSGKIGTVPASQLPQALAEGYTRVD